MDKFGISLLFTQIALLIVISGGIITSVKEHNQTPDTVYIQKKYSDWELLKVAIIWTESKGQSEAVNNKAYGIYQITPIYIKECNRILGNSIYTHTDAFNDSLANEMYELLQSHHNNSKDVKRAIRLHNKGDRYYNEVMDKFRMLKYLNENK